MTYLTNEEKPDEVLVYKKILQERNFDEESEFNTIFCPNRESKFHVNYKDIDFIDQKKKDKKIVKDFKLDYDQLIVGGDTPSALGQLSELFESFGFGKNEATEDDQKIPKNATPPRPESEPDNEGDNTEKTNFIRKEK